MAEEVTRLILYGYLHIYNCTWSLPAKCTQDLHYLQLISLEAGYGRLPRFILPSFPIILITSVEIIAILNYSGLFFYAILSFIFQFIEARL